MYFCLQKIRVEKKKHALSKRAKAIGGDKHIQ